MISRSQVRVLAVLIALAAIALLPVSSAYASGYLSWSDALAGNPGNAPSPHGGYTTATSKCKVCHAVHEAQAGGEVLLRSTITDACNYCHVGGAGGYTQVYDGDPALYAGTDYLNAHNWVDGSSKSTIKCTKCHQVHGATDFMTDNAALTRRILIDFGGYGPAGAPQSGDSTETALTKWCDGCHTVALPGPPLGELGGARWTDLYDDYSHIMTTATASYGGSGSYTGRVAWKDSTYCTSCHASGFGAESSQSNNFPHYTDGIYFLVQAANSTVATAPASNSEQDGVCLRCHRNATTGVQTSY